MDSNCTCDGRAFRGSRHRPSGEMIFFSPSPALARLFSNTIRLSDTNAMIEFEFHLLLIIPVFFSNHRRNGPVKSNLYTKPSTLSIYTKNKIMQLAQNLILALDARIKSPSTDLKFRYKLSVPNCSRSVSTLKKRHLFGVVTLLPLLTGTNFRVFFPPAI